MNTDEYFAMLRKLAADQKASEDSTNGHNHQKNHTDRNKPPASTTETEEYPPNPS